MENKPLQELDKYRVTKWWSKMFTSHLKTMKMMNAFVEDCVYISCFLTLPYISCPVRVLLCYPPAQSPFLSGAASAVHTQSLL